MGNFLDPLLSFVLLYRYVGLFVLQFLSALGVPIPAATIIMAAAAFAGEGYLDLPTVIAVALAGNVAGDMVAFWLVRLFGERALRRLHLGKVMAAPRTKSIERAFFKHERFTIVWSRFIGLATVAINIFSGLSSMIFRRFIVWDSVGQALSVTSYALVGYFVGSDWEEIANLLGHISTIVICVVVAGVIVVWQWRKKRARQRNA